MAIYNELQAPRYARMLQKLFGIKGGVPAKALAGDVVANFQFFTGVENRWLEEWSLGFGLSNLGAVAGNTNAARLFNPPGSGVIVAVTSIWFILNVAAAALPFMSWGGGGAPSNPAGPYAGGVPGTIVNMDIRSGSSNTNLGARLSAGVSGKNNNNTIFGTVIRQGSIKSGDTLDFITAYEGQEIVLAPDTQIDINNNNANSSCQISFMWRERPLEEAERR